MTFFRNKEHRFRRAHGRRASKAQCAVWALVVGAAWTAPAFADQIITDAENHTRVRVTGFDNGLLHLRFPEESTGSVSFLRVRRMVIDSTGGMADFNEAERYFDEGNPQRAVARYERAARVASGFWLDIIEARLVQSCERSNDFDATMQHFIALSRINPPLAAKLFPKGAFPPQRNGQTRNAVNQLMQSASKATLPETRALCEMMAFAILVHTGEGHADARVARIAAALIPPQVATPLVYEPKISALESLLAAGGHARVVKAINDALVDCPMDIMPELLCMKGRAQLASAKTRESTLEAAATLMRVPIHFSNDKRAPDALYWAAVAHVELNRPEKATRLLDECLAHRLANDSIKEKARAERSRLIAS